MSTYELEMWAVYNQVQPIDHIVRLEFANGITALNTAGNKNSRLKDFVIDYEGTKEQSQEVIRAKINQFKAGLKKQKKQTK